ncbi:MAG: DUF1987 domain-containing protein [Helicobacteraceae bacterium]|nr:DUF1987 domain-containing protein [Helicobacteraceae bacterium]
MKNLNIEATKYTPRIDLNAETDVLSIAGKSYPENTFEFYKPVVEWVEEYFKETKNDKTVVNLDLEYLNSSSLKAYFDLLDILEIAHDAGQDIETNWIYDEENDISEETGEDFQADFKGLDIKLVVK